jgi:putative redox protein
MQSEEITTAAGMEKIHISTTLEAGPNRRILARTRGHEIVMDIRKERGGDDAGPTPPECLVIALGGCIFNICRILARERQIVIEDLRLSISGDVDPSRAFGFDTGNRAGFSEISVQMQFTSPLSDAEKDEFYQELLDRCPLCDTIGNPTPLRIEFVK